jgi:hypothetical protein
VGAIEKLLPVFRSALIGAAMALSWSVVGWSSEPAMSGPAPDPVIAPVLVASGTANDTPLPLIPAPPTAAHEADKAATFQRYAKVFAISHEYPNSSDAFCQGFLDDLIKLNGVEFVEPTMRATRFADQGLAEFRKVCGRSTINRELMSINPRLPRPNEKDIVRNGKGYAIAYYSSANFRVYELPILNEESRLIAEPHYIFYGENSCRLYSPWDCMPAATYKIVTRLPGQQGFCKAELAAQVLQPYDVMGDDIKVGESVIVKYKGFYLILSAAIPSPRYVIGHMNLATLKSYTKDHQRISCHYKLITTITP